MEWFSVSRLFTFCVIAVISGSSFAYAGGNVKGKVTFLGKLPPQEKFVFESFPNSKYCGKHPDTSDEGRRRVINPVVTGQNGALKHAIVYVEGIQDSQWMKKYERTNIDIRLCDFLPPTGIVVNGKNIRVVNHDADTDDPASASGIAHTVRAYEVLTPRSKPLFGVGLPIKGSELNKKVKMKMSKRGSIIRLTCDQHEWMRSFLLPIKNPFFSLVDEKGSFLIENIPPGKHSIVAWHPVTGRVVQTIEVPGEGSIDVDIKIEGK